MRDKNLRDNTPPPVDMRSLTLTLTVSIFIALLAFFMVMNALSPDSAVKHQKLRASLGQTFGFVGFGQSVTDTGSTGAGALGDAAVAAAQGLRSVLPDIGFQSSRLGETGQMMVVRIPRDDFNARWPDLSARLSNVLVNHNRGGAYSLQILALDGPDKAGELVANARQLVEEGVDEDLIGIGYINRGTPSIELRFITSGVR